MNKKSTLVLSISSVIVLFFSSCVSTVTIGKGNKTCTITCSCKCPCDKDKKHVCVNKPLVSKKEVKTPPKKKLAVCTPSRVKKLTKKEEVPAKKESKPAPTKSKPEIEVVKETPYPGDYQLPEVPRDHKRCIKKGLIKQK